MARGSDIMNGCCIYVPRGRSSGVRKLEVRAARALTSDLHVGKIHFPLYCVCGCIAVLGWQSTGLVGPSSLL
jgi:hypothetical protein